MYKGLFRVASATLVLLLLAGMLLSRAPAVSADASVPAKDSEPVRPSCAVIRCAVLNAAGVGTRLFPSAEPRAPDSGADPVPTLVELVLILMAEYPEGSPAPYVSEGKAYPWLLHRYIIAHSSCDAVCFFQDLLYGSVQEVPPYAVTVTTPYYHPAIPTIGEYQPGDELHIGDIIRFTGHTVMIYRIDENGDSLGVVQFIANTVSWSRTLSRDAVATACYIITRVPTREPEPEEPEEPEEPREPEHDCKITHFTDVMEAYPDPENPYHQAIEWAYQEQIITGMNAATFGVGTVLTRTQCAAICYAAAGRPDFDAETAENPFSDIQANKWYSAPVQFAYSKGLVSGMSAGVYGVHSKLTMSQIAVILYSWAGRPSVEGLENPYANLPANKWYRDAAIWMACSGVLEPGEDGKFSHNAPCARETMALFLFRFMTGEDGSTVN